jgi:hypothetical protein
MMDIIPTAAEAKDLADDCCDPVIEDLEPTGGRPRHRKRDSDARV